MAFTPRPYQIKAITAAKDFFNCNKKYNAIEILPTGSGKSVVIANIAMDLPGKTIVLQPSIEILKQNYAKFLSYGYRAGIYSASANKKFIDRITFATIGSVIKKKYLFADVKHIIIDECHLVNAEAGMYFDFINSVPDAKVLGLTATPYRLGAGWPDGAMLKFITRTQPKIFNKVIYYIQNNVLFDAGHLAKLEYFSHEMIDRGRLQTNSNGTDFTEASLKQYYSEVNFTGKTIEIANRLGEVCLTPFMGVGSEVFAPVALGRKAIGVELKDTYYKQAIENMKEVYNTRVIVPELFDEQKVSE